SLHLISTIAPARPYTPFQVSYIYSNTRIYTLAIIVTGALVMASRVVSRVRIAEPELASSRRKSKDLRRLLAKNLGERCSSLLFALGTISDFDASVPLRRSARSNRRLLLRVMLSDH